MPFSEAPCEGAQSWFHFPPAVRVVEVRKRKTESKITFSICGNKETEVWFRKEESSDVNLRVLSLG